MISISASPHKLAGKGFCNCNACRFRWLFVESMNRQLVISRCCSFLYSLWSIIPVSSNIFFSGCRACQLKKKLFSSLRVMFSNVRGNSSKTQIVKTRTAYCYSRKYKLPGQFGTLNISMRPMTSIQTCWKISLEIVWSNVWVQFLFGNIKWVLPVLFSIILLSLM